MTFQLIIIFPFCDNLPAAFLKINLQNEILKKKDFSHTHAEGKTDKTNTWEYFTNEEKKIFWIYHHFPLNILCEFHCLANCHWHNFTFLPLSSFKYGTCIACVTCLLARRIPSVSTNWLDYQAAIEVQIKSCLCDCVCTETMLCGVRKQETKISKHYC